MELIRSSKSNLFNLSIFFLSFVTIAQTKTETDLFGRWKQKNEKADFFIGFETDRTIQLYDNAETNVGNLKNTFTYKLYQVSGEYQIIFYVIKGGVARDSLVSTIKFINPKKIVIAPISGRQGLFKQKEEFSKVK